MLRSLSIFHPPAAPMLLALSRGNQLLMLRAQKMVTRLVRIIQHPDDLEVPLKMEIFGSRSLSDCWDEQGRGEERTAACQLDAWRSCSLEHWMHCPYAVSCTSWCYVSAAGCSGRFPSVVHLREGYDRDAPASQASVFSPACAVVHPRQMLSVPQRCSWKVDSQSSVWVRCGRVMSC